MKTIFLGLLLLVIHNLNGQVYENLVFEGGGIRGIAYCGALEVLEKEGRLKDIKRVAGTSVGAIQAALLAVGYSSREMESIISDLNLRHFNDGKFIFIGGFHRLIKKYGWYRGEKLLEWIDQLIYLKTGNGNITFKELHDFSKKTGHGKFKDLYITGTNLSQQQAVIFSHENFPEMKVKDAIRISISIPFYFKAVYMDSIGTIQYNSGKITSKLDVLVDGGILTNFPLTIFDSTKYINSNDSVNLHVFNPATLGIRLDSNTQLDYNKNNKGIAPYPIIDFKSYIGSFYNIIIENLNRKDLSDRDWERIISVSTKGIGPKIKRLPLKSKNILIESGKEGAQHFFDNKVK